ncbi:MAG TPA: DUF4065 domain-containing protein [Candidatus Onthousia excrementipullorum]|uniref:DUF4065 domain-containing protein n=1 Tax=Candidatus Onthousia excrementipullorum TaxID=2840884 RepID=A0A9D1DT44_9FIRM|nr:DUF4065 domain-containing protein [Candidatus Onthousia excrementipullorum]
MKNNNLRVRKVKVQVKDKIISYDEYYLVDELGEEIFNREIEIENDNRLYNTYKKQKNLLTSTEIKEIRKKYGLTQKEYAFIIGVGEITIHRFEKGAIQTEAVDSIMRLSNNPNNMYFLLLKNKNNITDSLYKSTLNKVQELITLKRHELIDINAFDKKLLSFKEENAIDVAENIIKIYNEKVDKLVKEYNIVPEYITNLKLQKLLYYVQAISLQVFEKLAFKEKIMAWSYGPVVNEVYQKYKENHSNEIKIDGKVKKISSGLEKVINEVIDSYGSMEANKLIDFTHEEEPWKNTEINKEIKTDIIKKYFNKVYEV